MQQTFKNNKNTLYLVATPIGNLEDITMRVLNIIKSSKVIFAEDTRVSSNLLNHYNIDTKLISYHEHEKYDKLDLVINYLNEGDVSLISDAGTPLVSDPGLELVKHVLNNGFNVSSIPGPTASITALTSSNLDVIPHLFLGFLPRKKAEMKSVLNKYKYLEATLIIYESPFRVKDTLKNIYELYGNRKVTIARELTKIYETFVRTTLKDCLNLDFINKGEYVIIVEKYYPQEIKLSIKELYEKYFNEGYREKVIFDKISKDLNVSKREIYQEIKIDNK